MALNQQKVEELLALFRQQYPNWQSFSDPIDPDFQRNEIDYKQNLIAKAKNQLAEPELRQLIDKLDYDGLIAKLRAIGQGSNLLFLKHSKSGDLNILEDRDLDKQAFGRSFYILLHGNDTPEARLNGYLDLIERHRLPNKWTFPTYFLFLCHPETDIFIKPATIGKFLDFINEKKFTSTPSVQSYAAIKQIAHQLKDLLHDYAPRDMVDIQSFIWVCVSALNNQPRYWKVAPGEDAWQWEDCRNQGFIAIGWDELGDISNLSRSEFDARREDLLAQHPEWNWSKSGVNQVWAFSQIKAGDRIIANKGKKEVLGIGTVTGSYYYDVNADQHKHRLPVRWENTEVRSINEPGWQRTLINLYEEKFVEIAGELSSSGFDRNQPVQPNLNCPFTPITFELLESLHASPRKTTYLARRDEFKQHLEEPFQKLFRQIAAQLPDSIRDRMETERKLFARILKNDFHHGGAWDFYWGAFYLKGGKRIEDAQLFMWMNHERLEVGFYIGLYGSNQRQQFLNNCQKHFATLFMLLEESLSDDRLWFGSRSNSTNTPWKTWLQDPGQADIHVSLNLPKLELLNYSADELTTQFVQVYQQLFPLVLLAIEEEPLPALSEYLNPDPLDEEDDLEPLNALYSLADCAAVTHLEEELLNDWVQAIDRKGQAVLYGPPGTGKTFLAHHLAKHLIGGGNGFVEVVQFHPAYTYEDFIQGIRPKRVEGGLDYPIVPGRFLEFCKTAQACGEHPCVLIIDELNRANLSQVFGELMYLLEYRDEKVYLASGEAFSIPQNVRIIGTMNTADRSIALVDHALRRRFAFLYVPPNYDGLRKYHQFTDYSVDNLVRLLTEINAQIGDPHYQLGTSFFLREQLSVELKSIWQLEIEPYLEEFFFDQVDKMKNLRWDKVEEQLRA